MGSQGDLSRKESKVRRADAAIISEISKLDDQIVDLRRKHDRLHDSNHSKREELNTLADKLRDLHNSRRGRAHPPPLSPLPPPAPLSLEGWHPDGPS